MKLLTGKCKKEFEKWLHTDPIASNEYYGVIVMCGNKLHNLPLSMQFGVIQDFAESKGTNL